MEKMRGVCDGYEGDVHWIKQNPDQDVGDPSKAIDVPGSLKDKEDGIEVKLHYCLCRPFHAGNGGGCYSIHDIEFVQDAKRESSCNIPLEMRQREISNSTKPVV